MLFPVELTVGADYMVVGYCDADCTDMDLAVGVVGEDHGEVSAFVTRLRTSVAALGPSEPIPAPLPPPIS